MPKIFTSKHQKIGETGEKIATKFLMKQGFSILDRNYTKPWGEIDIIAKKSNKIYFIEVKSVSSVSEYRPEDNLHKLKMKRMAHTIQTYFSEKNISEEKEWQIDLLIVFMDFKNKKAKIKVVKDIILC